VCSVSCLLKCKKHITRRKSEEVGRSLCRAFSLKVIVTWLFQEQNSEAKLDSNWWLRLTFLHIIIPEVFSVLGTSIVNLAFSTLKLINKSILDV